MIETNDIYNLAGTFSYLSEIDSGLLDKEQQEKLAEMKDKVLTTLAFLIDSLLDISDENQ